MQFMFYKITLKHHYFHYTNLFSHKFVFSFEKRFIEVYQTRDMMNIGFYMVWWSLVAVPQASCVVKFYMVSEVLG